MAIEEVKYYIVTCDHCGTDPDNEPADSDLFTVIAQLEHEGWTITRFDKGVARIVCPECTIKDRP